MNKKLESNVVIQIRFRKGKRLADKTSQTLTQSVVPSLNMSGLPSLFANRLMSLPQSAKNGLIGLPKITESGTVSIGLGQTSPEVPTAFFTAITDEVGHNLSSSSTKSYPDPAFVFFEPTKDHSSSSSRTSSALASARGGSDGN